MLLRGLILIKKIKLETSLAFLNPDLAKEWHPTKNGNLKPQNVTKNSNRKVWWRCVKRHEWKAIVNSRSKGSGCPYCSGLRAIKGETDLATINPELPKEWHPTKNGNLKSSEVTAKSSKKVWWQCEKGHEWEAVISKRSGGNGCPYCSGNRVIKGETDLASTNPKLAKEWHSSKNRKWKPNEVTAKSSKKVWWKCGKDHEWEATIASRSGGSGCPYCSGLRAIKGETDLATINPKLANEWHCTKNKNLKPNEVTHKSGKKVWWQCGKGHEWEATISNRSLGRDCPYCSGHRAIKGETDLATINPKLANEWHCTKNKNLKPNEVTHKSNKKVWWRCEKNHEWEATIASRSEGKDCPYCSGLRAIKGETDLATINPKLANEWNCTKNKNLKPNKVTHKSGKKVWWQCVKGHEWEATIAKRSGGKGCPYCSGRKPIKGETDLATINPDLAKEWHSSSNGKLKPNEVTVKSNKKVWWKCGKDHEWEATIGSRSGGSGCPFCSGLRAIKGETDLATINPKLANEWHLTKNENLKLDEVTEKSGKKVWWQCEKGHEWETTVINRSQGNGCPYCSGHRAVKGESDLATKKPELAKEWNSPRNRNLKLEDIAVKSNKKVWWQCEKGHEWEAAVNSRTAGNDCPYCSGYRAIKGETDLATINPELAKEWHPTMNGKLKPDIVTSKSGKKVWWQCEKGHEWEALVSNRSKGSGCPYCSGYRAIEGESDLATRDPELAKEWHPTKNGILKPDAVTIRSGKKVWWICSENHEWRAAIGARSKGSKCPVCRRNK